MESLLDGHASGSCFRLGDEEVWVRTEQEEGGWGQTGPSWCRAEAGEVRRWGARAGACSAGESVPGQGSRTGAEAVPGWGGPCSHPCLNWGLETQGLPAQGVRLLSHEHFRQKQRRKKFSPAHCVPYISKSSVS